MYRIYGIYGIILDLAYRVRVSCKGTLTTRSPHTHTQEHTIGKIPNFRARQNSKMNVPTLFFKALKMHIPSSIVTNPVYKIWMLPLLYKALTKIEQLDRSVGGEVFCRCDTGT